MTVLISSAAACLLSEAVLLAAAFAALCLLITLHSIAYRMAIDSVATSVQSRFQLAAAAEANDELTYIMSPALSETESMCALQRCVQDADHDQMALRFSSGRPLLMTCAVCLSEMRWPEEEVGQLQCCRHVFHTACIHAWLSHRSPATCPLCRARLISPSS